MQECAIKFFTHRGAFDREKQLYECGVSGLNQMMAAVKHLEPNGDGALLMAPGRPFPPCIVVEVRGPDSHTPHVTSTQVCNACVCVSCIALRSSVSLSRWRCSSLISKWPAVSCSVRP